MCSRVLATIFIIYCLNTGFCEDVLDLSCTKNSDCDHFQKGEEHNVTCIGNECICRDNNNDGEKIKCEPITMKTNIVGGPCPPCTIKNSTCDPKDKICLCDPGFIPSMDKRRCIKKSVHLEESCEDNSQCLSAVHFSVCDPVMKNCTCLEHFIEHSRECLSTVALEENCDSDLQCANRTVMAICSKEKKCVCSLGSVANKYKSKCLKNAGYLKPCEEDNQCKLQLGSGATCNDYICTCDDNHYSVKNNETNQVICKKNKAFGDYCKDDNDCHEHRLDNTIDKNLECYLSECRCREGFNIKDGVCQISGVAQLISTKCSSILLPFFIIVILKRFVQF